MNPDEIVAHVNFYNNGEFLRDLFAWAKDAWPPPPSAPRVRFEEAAPARDLVLTCHRVDLPHAREGDELVVNQIVFGPKWGHRKICSKTHCKASVRGVHSYFSIKS